MITSFKQNVSEYSNLFNKATIDLTKHDSEGNEVAQGSADAVIKFVKIDNCTEDIFYEKICYVENDGEFEEAGNYIEGTTYYELENAISTLQQYFHYIRELNLIRSEIYTRLPLIEGEPLFEVNLNTRTITVPSDFSKNGIAVTGDKRAEYLWFKVPRYYDATDLSIKRARIEWKTSAKENNEGVSEIWGSGAIGKDINGKTMYSFGYDLETEPEYIILGWCIEDYLTQLAGKITFSIRFYELEDESDILKFSLGTQPASLTIKAGTNYSISDTNSANYIYDNQVLERDRFTNSPITAAAETYPEVAVFVDLADVGLPEALNLTEGVRGSMAMSQTINVQALSTDGGTISYRWVRTDLEGKNPETIPAIGYYVPTQDTSKQANKKYYQKNIGDGDRITYSVYTGSEAFGKEELYERVSSANINKTGIYTVTAINRVGGATNQEAASRSCSVLAAEAPVFADNFSEQAHIIIQGEEEIVLDAKASATHFFGLENDCVLTYQWYKDEEIIENATGSTLTLKASDDNKNTIQGKYFVKVTNTLNNTQAQNESDDCRVTFPASKPFVENPATPQGQYIENYPLKNQVKIEARITDPENTELANRIPGEDTLTYQWYKWTPGAGATEESIKEKTNIARTGEFSAEEQGVTVMNGATEASYIPETEGWYFCLVTNTFNGDRSSVSSALFQFQDPEV